MSVNAAHEPLAKPLAAPVPTMAPVGNANPDVLRTRHEAGRKTEHGAWRWAHFVNIGLGSWLLTQPLLVGVQEAGLRVSEMVMGLLLMAAAGLALSWRAVWARWLCAGVGTVVMALPFLFSTANGEMCIRDRPWAGHAGNAKSGCGEATKAALRTGYIQKRWTQGLKPTLAG